MTINVNNGQFKLESGHKGKILEIGTFYDYDNPVGWTFSGENEVAALEISDNGRIIRWAGFTLEELHSAYDNARGKHGHRMRNP